MHELDGMHILHRIAMLLCHLFQYFGSISGMYTAPANPVLNLEC